jgi:hypothetical protein
MKLGYVRLALVAGALFSLLYADRRISTTTAMAEAATEFLSSLDPDQRARVVFPADAESRTFWHFIPTPDVQKRYGHPRPGLTLREMNPEQQHLAGSLLSAGLSGEGYRKARTIMSLEAVLRELEGDSGERRDPLKYHFSIFGDPASDRRWGYRIEGHHISLHYTVVDGKLIGAPSFFGANPRKIPSGPRKGSRTLPREEDLGRRLVKSLNQEQLGTALVSEKAYADILSGTEPKAVLEEKDTGGLSAAKLTGAQREILDEIVAEYAASMPPEVAAYRLEQYKKAGNDIRFAWAGSTEPGGPHYYRVHAPSFLIEYDCTQNQANHIHAVWRDFDGDFGLDILARHYAADHAVVAVRD